MSPPLPLPSKAALRALRSIALGTSCAIGVIVEDRRRRISTLHTAVANKQKLKASRHYHQRSPGELAWQLDDAVVIGCNLQWREREEYELGKHREAETTDHTSSENTAPGNKDTRDLFQETHIPNLLQIPPQIPTQPLLQPPLIPPPPLPPPLQPTASQNGPFGMIRRVPAKYRQRSAAISLRESHGALIISIEELLASTNKESLDKAVSLFISNSSAIPSSPRLDRWLEVSVRLSEECQRNGRWEEASQILTTVIGFGPMDEVQYLAYKPSPIIEFHLRRQHPDVPCSTESVNLAARLFLLKFKERHPGCGASMEASGRLLLLEALSAQRAKLTQYIYTRLLGWAENPETTVRWAIHTFFQHNDHKNVIKTFLLQYSRMQHPNENFNETMDCVIGSFEALGGLKATSLLEALARMECPGDKLRTRWIMRLLRVYWTRHEDMSKIIELFEKAVSLGLLEKVSHPEGVYLALIEFAAQAGNRDVAYSYADKLIRAYPATKHDVALKLVVLKAKAGEWDDVFQTFRQVRADDMAEPAGYGPAFFVVLQVFAGSHSASETQDLAMQFIQDTGSEFHAFMVTLVANKYGEARDMNGFISWLELCSRQGFALDAGLCNSVLSNCSTTWKVPFRTLRWIQSKLEAINPSCSDEVTHRILSQAAHREGKAFKAFNRARPKAIAVSKLAYSGRSANNREIYEAMNQELMSGKTASAIMIYKQAIRFGMSFCSHCLRLAVLAALRGKSSSSGAGPAFSMIQDAHAEGHDVGPAVSTYIKYQIDSFSGNPADTIMHMRNLISRLESSQIVVGPVVLTHMAEICVKVGHHEKAISLCKLAADRSGGSHLCFSRQSFKALASAYSQLLDVQGMNSLIYDMSKSEFSTDRILLSHLKSIHRFVKKGDPSDARGALLEGITRGIEKITKARAEILAQGQRISQAALRIVGDAVADLEKSNAGRQSTTESISSEGPARPMVVGC
ncbi:hypothetical protein F5Y10DRAFT_235045 [Nemania abortiva]|nr:hypothetical protein F5Y10DRAFT_235045 [Nemania abortiva]